MDFLEQKEYQTLQGEEELSKDTLSASQVFLERELKGEMGQQLKEFLRNPTVVDEREEKRVRRRRKKFELWRKLKGLLSANPE